MDGMDRRACVGLHDRNCFEAVGEREEPAGPWSFGIYIMYDEDKITIQEPIVATTLSVHLEHPAGGRGGNRLPGTGAQAPPKFDAIDKLWTAMVQQPRHGSRRHSTDHCCAHSPFSRHLGLRLLPFIHRSIPPEPHDVGATTPSTGWHVPVREPPRVRQLSFDIPRPRRLHQGRQRASKEAHRSRYTHLPQPPLPILTPPPPPSSPPLPTHPPPPTQTTQQTQTPRRLSQTYPLHNHRRRPQTSPRARHPRRLGRPRRRLRLPLRKEKTPARRPQAKEAQKGRRRHRPARRDQLGRHLRPRAPDQRRRVPAQRRAHRRAARVEGCAVCAPAAGAGELRRRQ